MLRRWILAIALAAAPTMAAALTLKDLQTADLNKDGKIQAGREMARYKALRARETGRAPDDANILAEITILEAAARQTGGIPLAELAEQVAQEDPCATESVFFVRKDHVDISAYNAKLPQSDAEGASLSIVNDRVTKNQTAFIDGIASYVIARNPCVPRPKGANESQAFISRYAVAPFVAAHGKLSSDPSTEKSELRLGVDAQFSILSGQIFNNQVVTLTPYYQTDFRGMASAYGATATWEPYIIDLRLGGRPFGRFSEFVDFFWKLQAELDVMHVEQAGLTNLTPNTDHAWIGGTVRAFFYPLPNYFDSRLKLTGTYKFYWDERSRTGVSLGSAALAYNLTSAASVSVEYKRGTDKDTLQKYDQYLARLNFKL